MLNVFVLIFDNFNQLGIRLVSTKWLISTVQIIFLTSLY